MSYLVAGIILLVFLIVASLLLVPFCVSLHLFKEGSFTQGAFRINWLGIRLIRKKIPPKKGKKAKEKGFDWRFLQVSLFIDSFPHLKNMVDAFLKSISVRRFSANVTIGLESKADTAVVSGYLWSLASVVNAIPKAFLSVEPDFRKKRLDGSLTVELRVRLLRIVVAFIRAFTKKPVRRFISSMRR